LNSSLTWLVRLFGSAIFETGYILCATFDLSR